MPSKATLGIAGAFLLIAVMFAAAGPGSAAAAQPQSAIEIERTYLREGAILIGGTIDRPRAGQVKTAAKRLVKRRGEQRLARRAVQATDAFHDGEFQVRLEPPRPGLYRIWVKVKGKAGVAKSRIRVGADEFCDSPFQRRGCPEPPDSSGGALGGGGSTLKSPLRAGRRYQVGDPCGHFWFEHAHQRYGSNYNDDRWAMDISLVDGAGRCIGQGDRHEPIVAAHSGRVVHAGWQSDGYGYTVIVNGGARSTRYSHLQGISVAVGQRVNRGEKIGSMGDSGPTGGVHLHFVVYDGNRNGVRLPVFDGQRVFDGAILTSRNSVEKPAPPDRDRDGIPDNADLCPNDGGSGGCPEIATQRIHGDFDGDGREDVIAPHLRASNGGVNYWFFRSTGTGFASPVLWANPAGFVYTRSRPVAGDFDNDGRDDLVVAHRRDSNGGVNLWFLHSTGNGFSAPALWSNPAGFVYAKLRLAAGDLDGDGWDDLAIAHRRDSNGGVNLWFLRSGGTSFEAPELWAGNPAGFAFDLQGAPTTGDFNDDGKDDLAIAHRRSNGGVNLWFFASTGSAFSAPALWANDPSGFSYTLMKQPLAGDFNDDGKDDVAIAHRRSNGSINLWVFASTGAAFAPPAAWASNPSGFQYATLRLTAGDFNDDGKDDLAIAHRRSNGGINLWFFGSTGSAFSAPALWANDPSGFNYEASALL